MKMIGIGMLCALLIDATVVRALLVPATMKLLGRWNWWAPAPLAPLVGAPRFPRGADHPCGGRGAGARAGPLTGASGGVLERPSGGPPPRRVPPVAQRPFALKCW